MVTLQQQQWQQQYTHTLALTVYIFIELLQTADKVSVEELDLPADGDIATAAVAAAVYPGGNRLVEDATLTLPAKRLIKTSMQTVDGQEIMYLDFPSETITRSGWFM